MSSSTFTSERTRNPFRTYCILQQFFFPLPEIQYSIVSFLAWLQCCNVLCSKDLSESMENIHRSVFGESRHLHNEGEKIVLRSCQLIHKSHTCNAPTRLQTYATHTNAGRITAASIHTLGWASDVRFLTS